MEDDLQWQYGGFGLESAFSEERQADEEAFAPPSTGGLPSAS